MKAAPRRKYQTLRKMPLDASRPLMKAQREIFCQLVASGVPVADAHKRAGFKGAIDAARDMRRSDDVQARVNWLLADRIEKTQHEGTNQRK